MSFHNLRARGAQVTDTGDPMKAPVVAGCTKQFQPYTQIETSSGSASTNLATVLKRYTSGTTKNPLYNKQLAQIYHQWVSLCTFTPTRRGDWYIQVRTEERFSKPWKERQARRYVSCTRSSASCAEPDIR